MKNKFLQFVPVGQILLFLFAILMVSLFSIRYFEDKELDNTRNTIYQLTEKSVHRQDLLTKMRKGSDYVHVNLLRFLFYTDTLKKKQAETIMLAEARKNDTNFLEYKKYITDNREQLLFDTLSKFRDENAKNRAILIQLVNANKEPEALEFNSHVLFNSYEKYQMANTPLANYVHERDNDAIKQISNRFSSYEKTRTWVNYSLFLVLGVLGFMIGRVIRKLRTSKWLLTESERKYRTLIERTTEIIETADAEGKFIFVNNAFIEKTGYNKSEISALTVPDILAPESKHLYKYKPSKSEGGEVLTGIRKTLQSKTGKKILVEGNVILNYKDDAFESSTAFFNDITEKVMAEKAMIDSEERYRQLFDLSPVSMWVINPENLHFIQANKASKDNYGYNEAELMSMTFPDIFIDTDNSKLTELINNKKKNEFKCLGVYRQKTKFDKEIEVEIYSSDILLNDSWRKIIIAMDVTEKNNYEQKLMRAIIKTQEDERYQIGAELHDNVCQILAATQMTMGVIKRTVPSTTQELLAQVDEHIKLATTEIRNLSHQLAPAFFDDTTLEEAFIRLLNNINIEEKFKIILDFDNKVAALPILLEVKLNLYRILQEQIRNIVKHAKASEITVQVSVNENLLRMQITDNGIGFDVEKAKGGIGLANMMRRATLFDGKFEVISSPGKGCNVIIEIPVANFN